MIIRSVPALLDLQIVPGDDFKRTFLSNVDLTGYSFIAQCDNSIFEFAETQDSVKPGYYWDLKISGAQTRTFFAKKAWSLKWTDLNGDTLTIISGDITPVIKSSFLSTQSPVSLNFNIDESTIELEIASSRGDPGYTPKFIFKVASEKPDTPTGDSPSGWSNVPLDGQNWVSQGLFDGAGRLYGTWSEPTRWNWALLAFAAFLVLPDTMHLNMITPDEYTGPNFTMADGHLKVVV